MSASGFGYSCAALVALIFSLAAFSKWRAPQTTRDAFNAQGIPFAGTVARMVPIVEGVVAVALIVVPRVGAVGALGLLIGFTAFLVMQVRRGSVAPCACFGATRARAPSRADLAGNGFLIVAATAALMADQPTWPGPLDLVLLVAFMASDIGAQKFLRTRRH